MSLLQSLTTAVNRCRSLPTRQRAWIGIDIGSRLIKLAQLACTDGRLQLVGRWTLGCDTEPAPAAPAGNGNSLDGRLQELRNLRRVFSGRRCAVVLPMSLVDLRSLEIPRSSRNEEREMVAAELAADLSVEPTELAFDCWETETEPLPNSDMKRMAAVVLPRARAERLGMDLLSFGLDCQTLDAVPCALARAVSLAADRNTQYAHLALDLGHSSPLLTLVYNGRPLFSRCLRGCSLHTITRPLQDQLQITAEECQQLLVRYGLPAPGQTSNLANHTTERIIAHRLAELINEIERTLDYIGHQFREFQPRRLWLFGGGATIKHFPEYLSQKLPLPAERWHLSAADGSPDDALYGVAAALSALAWENRPCT